MYQSALRAELAPLVCRGLSGVTAWGSCPTSREPSYGRSRSVGSRSKPPWRRPVSTPNEQPKSPPSPPVDTSPVTSSTTTCFATDGRRRSRRSPSATRPGGRGRARSPISPGPSGSARASLCRVRVSDTEREEILAVLAGERSVDLADYDLSDPMSARVAPLTLFASTFTYRAHALAAVARAFDASPRQVARLTRQLLDRDDVLWMIGDGNRQPDVSGKRRERRAATLGDRRYTTVEMLRVEGRIVNSAVRRVGRCRRTGEQENDRPGWPWPDTAIWTVSRPTGCASSSDRATGSTS